MHAIRLIGGPARCIQGLQRARVGLLQGFAQRRSAIAWLPGCPQLLKNRKFIVLDLSYDRIVVRVAIFIKGKRAEYGRQTFGARHGSLDGGGLIVLHSRKRRSKNFYGCIAACGPVVRHSAVAGLVARYEGLAGRSR